MNTQISFQNIETASQPGLEASILVMVKRRVERYLPRVTPDTPAALKVTVEKSRHRDYHRISIELAVSGITLAVREEGQHLLDTVGKAFDELERELLRHVARQRQDEAWRRHEQREELRRLKRAIAAGPPTAVEEFGKVVRDLMPRLQQFVEREMAALRARADLNPGYPTPQDIVDEVLARAFQRLGQRPKDLEPLQWLYKIVHEVLNDEARHSPRERPRDFTLEEQDQGVYQLWRPEEMLRMKDVAPVSEATPEANLEEQDVRAYFHDVLAKMPNNWRRAIWLTQAEGIPVAKVAQMMGTSETELKRWVQLGDDYLRARLREAGYELAPPGKPGVSWFEPTPAVQTGLLEALDDVMQGAQ
jgi:RNA polymerase sigma factor (sigma-70 family)